MSVLPINAEKLADNTAVSTAGNRVLRLLRSAPATEPPSDDEIATGTRARLHLVIGGQTTELPELERPIFPAPAPEPSYDPWGFDPDLFAHQPTPSSRLPEPSGHARKLTQAIVETLGGHRPLQQLSGWLHGSLYFELCDRQNPQRRLRIGSASTARVRSVRISQLSDSVIEASAVIMEQDQVYAAALRLEGLDGRWQCTFFEII